MTNELIIFFDAGYPLAVPRMFVLNNLENILDYTGQIIIDWGDGTVETYTGNTSHTYATDDTFEVKMTGNITGIKDFYNRKYFVKVIIPEGVTYLNDTAFHNADELSSVTIPSSVTTIGSNCFLGTNIEDYQLYWTENIITYNSYKMPMGANCIFTIPYGATQKYVNAGYPLAKLSERDPKYATVNDAANDNPNAIILEYDASIALSFENDLSNPFTYTGSIEIDWGDGTEETYSGGLLSHTYASEKTFIIVINGGITQINDGNPNTYYDSNYYYHPLTGAFHNVYGIVGASLSDNITNIGNLAFSDTNLSYIKISPNTTRIGIASFARTKLTSFRIPPQTTTVDTNAFVRSAELESIVIPESVTTLGNAINQSGCCYGCPITEYQLYWQTDTAIIQYNEYLMPVQNDTEFYIPKRTTDLYVAKGYPLGKLVERIGKEDTLNGALEILGERMADNLVSMGVSADASEGLIPLANKILTIQKTNGVLLSTALSLDANLHQIPSFENTTLTATLYASYDDESVYDNDLAGIIQGAEISFYNNDDLIGTAITDVNGVATLTEYNIEPGTYVYTAEYDGTADYENAESDPISVTCYNDYEMTVQDRYIGEVGDTINVDVHVTNNSIPVANATISMTGSDGSEYSVDTNANGVAVFELDSLDESGVYEYEIEYGSLSAECEVINAFIYDKGLENDHTTYWSNNANIVTSRGDTGTTFTNNSSNNQSQLLDYTISSDNYDYNPPFAYEFDFISYTQTGLLFITNSTTYDANDSPDRIGVSNGDHVKVTVEKDYIKFYVNGEEAVNRRKNNTATTPFRVGFRLNPNESFTFKNYVIYSLPYEPVYELSFDSDTIYGEVGDSIPVNVNYKDQYGRGILGESIKLSTNEDKFVDKATIGQKNTNWTTNMSNSNISVSSDGTTLSMTKTDSDIYYQADVVLTGDFEITYNAEFTNSNSIRALFKSTDTSKTLQFNHFTNGLWRIRRTDGVFKFEVSTDNGETWTTKTNIEGTPTLTTEDCTFRFYQPVAETRIIKYSDFKMTHYLEYTSNTNSSGVATFSISDLSTSGKYVFEASYGNLTAECIVINALFYDKGITGAKNTEWGTNVPDYGSATVTDNGTVLSTSSTAHGYNYFPNLPNTSSGNLTNFRDWNDNIAIEFDIVSSQGNNSGLSVEDVLNISFQNMWSSSSESNVHIKLTFNDGVSECYVNNSQTSVNHKEYTSFINKYIFLKCSGGETFTFKEFVIYSTSS